MGIRTCAECGRIEDEDNLSLFASAGEEAHSLHEGECARAYLERLGVPLSWGDPVQPVLPERGRRPSR